MSDMGKNLLLWLIIAAVLLTVFNNFNPSPQPEQMAYSDFVKAVHMRQIREVKIQGDKITAADSSGNQISVVWPESDQKLMNELIGDFKPDVLIHTAVAYKDPTDWVEDTLTNTTGGTLTVDQVQFQLSSVSGIVQGDFANLEIVVDEPCLTALNESFQHKQ